ncbi:DHS-like NAD/FAD-binding domain-containing protein [Cytidiella melzeri]|nr:DHS-like NAD/FAD-binding domain-containing protein [Cytidiella melzeri]
MPVTLNLDNYAAETSTRRTLASLSLAVAKCKKIVVVTGAGISCSCGIPDFRSSDGLYALVKEQYPDVVLKGRDLFDASLFRDSTSTAVFYTFISQLKQSIDRAEPSSTHRFVKTLDSKRKLLRSYTQNIDGLEERAGLLGSSSQDAKASSKGKGKIRAKDVRNVQLHGDIHRVRCTFCSAEFPSTEEHVKSFDAGVAPDCPDCLSRSEARQARSARALKVGTLRPAIVLYDEPHPLGDDIGTIQTSDLARKPDMLIIMGTSLKVHGFKKLVKEFAKTVHESPNSTPSSSFSPSKTPNNKTLKNWTGKVVFVNKTAPGSEWDGIIDYHVQGDSDTWVEKVMEDWKKMRPADWEVQKRLDAGGSMKVMKEVTNAAITKPKAANGKKRGMENKRAEDVPLPMSPPPSPSKRRSAECHYSNGEGSPSKKKKRPQSRAECVDFEGRGLLFAETTNLVAPLKDAPTDGVEDVFSDVAVKERPGSRLAGRKTAKVSGSRKNLKVEVVLPAKRKVAAKSTSRPPSRAALVR